MISEAAKPVICEGHYLNPAASLVPRCKGCFGLFVHLEKILLITLSHLWNIALWWQHCCGIEDNLCFTIRQLRTCSHISDLWVMSLKDEAVKRETKQKTVDSHCILAKRRTFHPGTNVLAGLDYSWSYNASLELKVLIAARKTNYDIKTSMSWGSCVSSFCSLALSKRTLFL